MKLVEHRSLWSAIQQFSLDEPGATITFSHKLAAQQNWSEAYTQQAIEEYRKFIFLCCIAPQGASPSNTVDEVWHLHLTYTNSYWNKLCKQTLGKDIHHHPSKGGDDENHKHLQWYTDTLQLYESVFESPPPANIWPPPKEDHLHIPDPDWQVSKQIKALTFLLLSIPFLIIAYLYDQFFPFTLKGPQFLVFFPCFAIASLIAYIIWQREINYSYKDLVTEHFPTDASIFQITHFLYGKYRATQTAIVDLTRRNLLELSHDQQFRINKQKHPQYNEQNPLLEALQNEAREHVSYDTILADWYKESTITHPTFVQLYHLAYRHTSFRKKLHFLLLPTIVGLIRCMQGVASNKPIGFLLVHLLVFVALAIVIINIFSKASAIFKKTKEIATTRQDYNLLYPDKIVNEYALEDKQILDVFSDGLLLSAIFMAYPVPANERKAGGENNGGFFGNGACSSGGSSNGGGGCGSGGGDGGGCGGGCGGCGGGD